MNRVRSVLAGIIVVALGGGLIAGPAGPAGAAVAPERKLDVRILTVDGKQRLRVKRKLAVLVGCTKNCSVVVDMKLVMPDDVLRARVRGGIMAFSAKSPSLTLNTPAIRYLRLSYPRSRFSIKVTATDVSNGRRTIKQKVFRFRR